MIMVLLDKRKVFEWVVERLEQEIGQMKTGYEEARRTSIEAPGRMQSRYDTMGVEAAWVADGLARNIEGKLQSLSVLRAFNLPASPPRVALGCIAGVGHDMKATEAAYFLLPGCGGLVIPAEVSSYEIRVITPQSPIGRELLGKAVGDDVRVRRQRPEPDVVTMVV